MRLGHAAAAALLPLLVALGVVPAADAAVAARAATTELSLGADPAYADNDTTLRIQLTSDGGQPLAGAQVTLERRTSQAWAPIGTVTTDANGRAGQVVTLGRAAGDNVFRATFAGDEAHEPATRQTRVELKRRGSRVVVGGPGKVVDGRSVVVRVRWTAADDMPVAATVELYRSLAGGPWKKARTLTTGDTQHFDHVGNRARAAIRPRACDRYCD
ncbi:hypothetical protein [Nocardioides sp.]|uniref:hypothetical protein n=1 Tax=Nocardioides sp. TaxID=35761 RepID=UPI00262FAEF5|nr:hypothetical protein [Nocardioides sp.]MDI6910853.1 hypothetical protein [Nocardioides sp.]